MKNNTGPATSLMWIFQMNLSLPVLSLHGLSHAEDVEHVVNYNVCFRGQVLPSRSTNLAFSN